MAANGDAENQAANTRNEETPLLVDRQSEQNDLDIPDEQHLQVKKLSWYLWRLFWGLIAALILGIFIKGWIDAGGDVDVGFG